MNFSNLEREKKHQTFGVSAIEIEMFSEKCIVNRDFRFENRLFWRENKNVFYRGYFWVIDIFLRIFSVIRRYFDGAALAKCNFQSDPIKELDER